VKGFFASVTSSQRSMRSKNRIALTLWESVQGASYEFQLFCDVKDDQVDVDTFLSAVKQQVIALRAEQSASGKISRDLKPVKFVYNKGVLRRAR
jgi:hypothetical protein